MGYETNKRLKRD
ncbi:hypothetical protein VCHC50A2_3355A, partial [Vibrio cholerae HC-50A2]